MKNIYNKCKLCRHRFLVQDWKVGIEKNINLLCFAKLKTLENLGILTGSGKQGKRMRDIIVFRFGLEDGITHTLEETGKMWSVTRERIRQLETKGLEIMRGMSLPKNEKM